MSRSVAISAFAVVSACAAWSGAQETEPVPQRLQRALEQADQRFVQQDFAGALALLEPECANSDRSICSFGLGAIHHALGDCGRALRYYRRYREQAPQGEHIAEVTLALQQLSSVCSEPAQPEPGTDAPAPLNLPPAVGLGAPWLIPSPFPPSQAVLATASPSPEDGPARHTVLLAGLLGLAGATGVTAVTFGLLAINGAQDCAGRSAYDSEYRALCETKEPRYRSLALGFGVASGAFLSAGAALWWLDQSQDAALSVPLDGSLGVSYLRRF